MSTLTNTFSLIANAIRQKVGGSNTYTPAQMPQAILDIPTGTDTSDATAVAGDILSGKTAYVNGVKLTGSITSKAAQTYIPGTTDQTIASGQYLSGTQTIAGDADLIASNIKKDVNIFGVTGTMSAGIECLIDGIEQTEDVSFETVENIFEDTLPYEFINGSAVIYNDEIHILGGQTSPYTQHYKWDGGSWILVSTLPFNFYKASAVVFNNEIHILSSTNHYKWNGSSWSSASTLPYNFYFGSAVVFNNEIHILGSETSGCYTKHYKWNGSSWSSASTLPYNFYRGTAVVYNNAIHILGSRNNSSSAYNKHYKWNGSSWSSASTVPFETFYEGTAVVYNNAIHILGTSYSDDSKKHYKWSGSSWSSASTLPYSYNDGSSIVYNDEIHILGGSTSPRTQHYKWSGSSWNNKIKSGYKRIS